MHHTTGVGADPLSLRRLMLTAHMRFHGVQLTKLSCLHIRHQLDDRRIISVHISHVEDLSVSLLRSHHPLKAFGIGASGLIHLNVQTVVGGNLRKRY